jgi:hypothetical protein
VQYQDAYTAKGIALRKRAIAHLMTFATHTPDQYQNAHTGYFALDLDRLHAVALLRTAESI